MSSKKPRADRRRRERKNEHSEPKSARPHSFVSSSSVSFGLAILEVISDAKRSLQTKTTMSYGFVKRILLASAHLLGTSVVEVGSGIRSSAIAITEATVPLLPTFTLFTKRFLILCFEVTLLAGVSVLLWRMHEPFLFQPLNVYDEGVTLMGAKRFALGEVPYRDFFTIYGPLKFSLLGAVFMLFGTSLFVARIFFMAVSLVGFVTIFVFFRKSSNIVYTTLFTILLLPFAQISLTPLLLVAIAFWFAVQLDNPRSHVLPFVGGGLLGALFLLRIDFGGLAALAVFTLVLLFWAKSRTANTAIILSLLGKLGFAFLAVVMPVFVALFWQGALGDFWQQAIAFPMFGTYQELRQLPWQSLASIKTTVDGLTVDFLGLSSSLIWFFWPVPFAIATLFWLWQAIRGKFALNGFLVNMLLGAFVLGAFAYANHRSDVGHVLFLNFLALVFFLHLLTQFRPRIVGLLFIPLVVMLMIFPASNYLQTLAASRESEKKAYSFFPTFFPSTAANDDLDRTLYFFKGIDKSAKVYVGVSDTSRIFVNNVMLPFLLEQPVATKYHELHTGVVTTASVQAEMVDELQDTAYVVLWDYFECEPNGGCQSSGVYLVDDYIRTHFAPVAVYGKYQILQRSGKTKQ